MVAHASPDPQRDQVAHQIAASIYQQHRAAIGQRLSDALPHADTATRQRAAAAFTQAFTALIARHLLATYVAGVDAVFAVEHHTIDTWLSAAISEAVAAAGCP